MNIHQVVASINIETGGPAVSVSALHHALLDADVQSRIHCLDYKRHGPVMAPEAGPFPIAGPVTRILRGWNVPLKNRLWRSVQSYPGVVHNHGCWMAPNLFARQTAEKLNCPLLISPRGMLENWALQFRSMKKTLAWHGFEKKNLETASAFHATSPGEAAAIRALGLSQPIYQIPNGVEIPSLTTDPSRINLPPDLQGPFLLFLSRIHEKKGIELLLSVWLELRKKFPDWSLVIAGPDLDGTRNRLARQYPETFEHPSIRWAGPVEGSFKTALLRESACLVLPSYSENFGYVVAESLAHRTPVLTTNQTPWAGLIEHDCGWIISPNRDDLFTSLLTVMDTPLHTLESMRPRGRAWMEADFSWPQITRAMIEAYAHPLGKHDAPSSLSLS